jgi:hypothetical protein
VSTAAFATPPNSRVMESQRPKLPGRSKRLSVVFASPLLRCLFFALDPVYDTSTSFTTFPESSTRPARGVDAATCLPRWKNENGVELDGFERESPTARSPTSPTDPPIDILYVVTSPESVVTTTEYICEFQNPAQIPRIPCESLARTLGSFLGTL